MCQHAHKYDMLLLHFHQLENNKPEFNTNVDSKHGDVLPVNNTSCVRTTIINHTAVDCNF